MVLNVEFLNCLLEKQHKAQFKKSLQTNNKAYSSLQKQSMQQKKSLATAKKATEQHKKVALKTAVKKSLIQNKQKAKIQAKIKAKSKESIKQKKLVLTQRTHSSYRLSQRHKSRKNINEQLKNQNQVKLQKANQNNQKDQAKNKENKNSESKKDNQTSSNLTSSRYQKTKDDNSTNKNLTKQRFQKSKDDNKTSKQQSQPQNLFSLTNSIIKQTQALQSNIFQANNTDNTTTYLWSEPKFVPQISDYAQEDLRAQKDQKLHPDRYVQYNLIGKKAYQENNITYNEQPTILTQIIDLSYTKADKLQLSTSGPDYQAYKLWKRNANPRLKTYESVVYNSDDEEIKKLKLKSLRSNFQREFDKIREAQTNNKANSSNQGVQQQLGANQEVLDRIANPLKGQLYEKKQHIDTQQKEQDDLEEELDSINKKDSKKNDASNLNHNSPHINKLNAETLKDLVFTDK